MIYQGCVAQVNASDNGNQTFQICSMTYNHNNDDEFVTISHDGMIKLWDSNHLTLKSSTRIKTGYLTSLITFQNGFIVGTGNGQLINFTNHFQKNWIKKLHFDCVNDLLQIQNQIVSIGSDGKICFLNKKTLAIEKEIQTSVPLSRISRFGDEIYVAGNPSFKVNLNTWEVSNERRSFQFMELQGEIFGCSDEQGLFLLGESDPFDYINCHFMLKLNGSIISISEESIGVISLLKQQGENLSARYQVSKSPNLKKGYSIKTGLVHGNQIILAGEDGFIYKFKFSNPQSIHPAQLSDQ